MSRISTAVMTFVLTPHATWTLTHSRSSIVLPYLMSNQRTNRHVLNPLESTANSDSTHASGLLDSAIRPLRSGVMAAFVHALHDRSCSGWPG